jgi:beta-glucosidase
MKQLAWYDTARRAFLVEPGIYDVQIGSSSDDIRLRGKITVGSASASHHDKQ